MLWRRDGTPFFAEYSSFPVMQGEAVTGSIITFTDISVRQDAQKRLTVQYAVAQVLAGTAAEDALPMRLLEAIGAGLDWDEGLLWRRVTRPDGHDVLRCTAVWNAQNPAHQGIQHPPHFGPTSLGRELELGAGLPGRVWVMEGPMHVADLHGEAAASPRAIGAARAGLCSAFAFPVMDAKAVVGAIEFYSRRPIATDESLLESLSLFSASRSARRWSAGA